MKIFPFLKDKAELERRVATGEGARRELRNTTEAFETLKENYHAAWEQTKPHQTDDRERLWQAIQIVGKVEAHLQHLIDEGKISAKQIETLSKG